jgi:hypothetical protein
MRPDGRLGKRGSSDAYEIAQLCGITRRTLIGWKKQPAIRKKMDEHLRLIQLHSEVEMISERQKRILHLDIRFQELQRLIRAVVAARMRGVPGGSTGLMRRRIEAFSQRHGRLPIYSYRLDIPLLREERRLSNTAAKALGQCQVPKYQPTVSPTSAPVPSGKQHRAALFVDAGSRNPLVGLLPGRWSRSGCKKIRERGSKEAAGGKIDADRSVKAAILIKKQLRKIRCRVSAN